MSDAATLLASGIAAHCNRCAKRRIGLQKLDAAQSRSSPDKWLLREGVAERRGASAKRCSVKK